MKIVVMRYCEKMNLLSVPDDELSFTLHKELEAIITLQLQVETIHEQPLDDEEHDLFFIVADEVEVDKVDEMIDEDEDENESQ